MRTVDFHAYLGSWPYWRVPYADETGRSLLSLMDRHGVDLALVTPIKSIFYNTREGNELLFQVTSQHPDRLVPAPVVNPREKADAGSYVSELVNKGAKAIYLFPIYHGYRLRSDYPPLGDILEAARVLRCPVVIPLRILMNWGFPALSVEPVLKLAREFGENVFVVGGFNYGEFADLIEGCRTLDNLWLETSCLTMMRGIEALAEGLGASRILCGTAMPLQYPGCGLVKVRDALLPQDQKEMILGRSATELLTKVGR